MGKLPNLKRHAPAPKKRKDKSKVRKTTNAPAKEPSPSPPPHSDEDLQKLLEPYSKDQLVTFLADAALANPSLLARVYALADADVSHRKIFVHGLSWDTTREDLVAVLSPFGTIDDCHVVLDKLTGRAKGFGFVVFATRAAADAALQQPQKKIRSRIASFQLASAGAPTHVAEGGRFPDVSERKLYVSNVHADTVPEKMREFFAKFGEIEEGPIGFDTATGKSRGFALFVYKNPEGLRKALEEPYKNFEGRQLYCKKALNKQGAKGVGVVPSPGASVAASGALAASTQQVLAAVAAQNLALYGQNPAYAAALLGQNALAAASVNQAALSPLNQAAVLSQAAVLNPATLAALGAGGLGSLGVSSTLGSQRNIGLLGLQHGQSLTGRPSGSLGGRHSLI